MGYHDLFPTKTASRALSVIVMLIGTLIIAISIAIVGVQFNSSWSLYKANQERALRGGLALLSEHAKSDKIIQMILDVVSTRAHMDVPQPLQ